MQNHFRHLNSWIDEEQKAAFNSIQGQIIPSNSSFSYEIRSSFVIADYSISHCAKLFWSFFQPNLCNIIQAQDCKTSFYLNHLQKILTLNTLCATFVIQSCDNLVVIGLNFLNLILNFCFKFTQPAKIHILVLIKIEALHESDFTCF